MSLNLRQLLQALEVESSVAAISATVELHPIGGEGGKVAPPTYPLTKARLIPYLIDKRRIGGETREVVLLDSEQSQANRCELGLREAHDEGRVRLPMFEVKQEVQTEAGTRTVRITSLDAPHRYADAYLRDTTLAGDPFDKSEIGKALRLAEPGNAGILLEREPYSLVYGAWDSHRKGRQAKFARIYDSTIIGFDPVIGFRFGGRLDPLNLTGGQKSTDGDWSFQPEGAKKDANKLSKIGHGNALAEEGSPGLVSISGARRLMSIHLAALRGVRFGQGASTEAAVAGRAMLVALALLGDRLAFGYPSTFLRSGCDLATASERIVFERPGGEDEPFTLAASEAIALFKDTVGHAREQGLLIADDVISLTPMPALAQAIEYAYTKATSVDE